MKTIGIKQICLAQMLWERAELVIIDLRKAAKRARMPLLLVYISIISPISLVPGLSALHSVCECQARLSRETRSYLTYEKSRHNSARVKRRVRMGEEEDEGLCLSTLETATSQHQL
jgi:hypothetical protein